MSRRLARAAVAVLVGSALATACSSRDHAPAAGDLGGPGGSWVPSGPCTNGDVQSCGIVLDTHDGVVDCALGTSTCVGGAWSACTPTGARTTALAPAPAQASPGSTAHTKTISGTSSNCADNPCNPYCQTYQDVPDAAITAEAGTVVIVGGTVSLKNSNTPPGFQMFGSDRQHLCGTPLAGEACQYDQRCGTNNECAGNPYAWVDASGVTRCCVSFATGEKGACTGVDITTAPVCMPADPSQRNVTICNRGTTALSNDVICYSYPGNSPQFPNDSPGVGTTVLSTSTQGTSSFATAPLAAGSCRTFSLPASTFPNSGNTSVICNPPCANPGGTVSSYPTVVYGTTPWQNPANAMVEGDGLSATASLDQTVLGPLYPTASTGLTNTWNAIANAYGSATGNYATVGYGATFGPELVGGASCASAADCAAGFVCPGTSGNAYCERCNGALCGTASPWIGYSVTGTNKLATTIADALSVDECATGNCGNPYKIAEAAVSPAGDATIYLKDAALQALAASASPTDYVSSITLYVDWSVTDGSLASLAQLQKADGTPLATVSQPNWSSKQKNKYYGQTTVAPQTGLKLADLVGAQVMVYTSRSSTGTNNVFFDLDAVKVTVAHHETVATATFDGFGNFGTVPATSTISGLLTSVTWNATTAAGGAPQITFQPLSGATGGLMSSPFTASLPASYVSGASITSTNTFSFATAPTLADFASPGFGLALNELVPPSDTVTTQLGVDAISAKLLAGNGPATMPVWYGGFAFALPSGASNIQVTTSGSMAVDATTNAVLQLVTSFDGGKTIAHTQTISPLPTTLTTETDGPFAAASATSVADPNLAIGVVATVNGTSKYGASLDWMRVSVSYGTLSGNNVCVGECNPYNNWASYKANPPTACDLTTIYDIQPWTYSRVFTGTCPSGTRVTWRRFGYSSTDPTGTQIQFRFRAFDVDSTGACVQQTAVTSSPPTPLAVAQVTSTIDTQICDVSTSPATTTCPVDLYAGLGSAPTAQLPCLQMDAYGLPNNTTGTAPTLASWNVVFDCLPNE